MLIFNKDSDIVTEDLTTATNTKAFSLQQRALHELAKKFWGEFILREIIDGEPIFIPYKTEKLIAHRNVILAQLSNSLSHILTTLPRTVSTKFFELLKDILVDAVIYLQQGYHEALIWEEKCQSALTVTALNPLTAGKYKAGEFY